VYKGALRANGQGTIGQARLRRMRRVCTGALRSTSQSQGIICPAVEDAASVYRCTTGKQSGYYRRGPRRGSFNSCDFIDNQEMMGRV